MLFYGKQNSIIAHSESSRKKILLEKRAAKLGFPSLYAYFEDKISNETQADKIKKQNKSFGKNKSVKKQIG